MYSLLQFYYDGIYCLLYVFCLSIIWYVLVVLMTTVCKPNCPSGTLKTLQSNQVKVKNSHLVRGHSEDSYHFLHEQQTPGSEKGKSIRCIIKHILNNCIMHNHWYYITVSWEVLSFNKLKYVVLYVFLDDVCWWKWEIMWNLPWWLQQSCFHLWHLWW